MKQAMKDRIYILGAGHIGIRLAQRLADEGRRVTVFDRLPESPEPNLNWQYEQSDLNEIPTLEDAAIVYVVTDEDRLNIRLILAVRSISPDLPIAAAISSSRLGRKLSRHLRNVAFITPPEIAARKFVGALDAPRPASAETAAPVRLEAEPEVKASWQPDPLVLRALGVVASLGVLTTFYFHYSEHLSWIDSWYFVVTLMTTVGFGDISLKGSSMTTKIIGSVLMIASVTNTAIIFALITDSLLRHRLALAIGRRRARQKNHVVVVGSGSVGLEVVEALLAKGESVTVIEKDINSRHMTELYTRRVPVIVGDATLERTLNSAGLAQARGLISVTSDDLTNLEVGLNAKLINPEARVVLRIYDALLVKSLNERLDIHFAFSTSAFAAQELAEFALKASVDGQDRSSALTD